MPQGGNHYAADTRLAGQCLDLPDCFFYVVDHGYQRYASPAYRVGGAELLQPAVVGPGAPKGLTRIGDLSGGQAGPEWWRLLPRDGIAISKDDLTGHPVSIQHGVTNLRVVGPL